MENWIEGTFCSLDFETTGPDPKTARVVECSMLQVDKNGSVVKEFTTLVNPEVSIPPEATAVHGIDNNKVQFGMKTKDLVHCLMNIIYETVNLDCPLVIFNVPYDWCVLIKEMERTTKWSEMPKPNFIDPLCMDKWLNKYRKGGRALATLATTYKIGIEKSHTAKDDALVSAKIARKMVKETNITSLEELQDKQRKEHEVWKNHINAYWKKNKIDKEVTNGWPL